MQPTSRQSTFSSDHNGAQNPGLPGAWPNNAAVGHLPVLQPQQQPQPQPYDAFATEAIAAEPPLMVFPGPYAYAQNPVSPATDDVMPDFGALPIPGSQANRTTTGIESATSSTTTSSTSTSSTSTSSTAVASGEPEPADPEDNPDGLPPFILAAAQGKLALLNEILSAGAFDIDMVDEKCGSSALMFAAKEGHLDVVARLIDAGADVNLLNAQSGFNAMTFAVRVGQKRIAMLLLSQPGFRPDKTGAAVLSLLQDAGGFGRMEIFEVMSEAGMDIDVPVMQFREPPLHAWMKTAPSLVASLLEQGADVNERNQAGLTPLAVAACNGYTEVLALLLKAPGIDLNLADFDGCTPLSHGAKNDHAAVVKQLKAAGAKVDVADLKGNTALMKAAHGGFIGSVQALLQHPRIRIDQRGEHDATALHFAAASGHAVAVQVLLHAGANTGLLTTNGDSAFDLAVRFRHTAAIEVLAKHGMPLAALSKVEYSVENAAFIATATDLLLSIAKPADPVSNPLGFRDPALLEQPLAFLSKLITKIEEYDARGPASPIEELDTWLMDQGFRYASLRNMSLCLNRMTNSWTLLANPGQQASMHHKLLYCASAISRLQTLGNQQAILDLYQGDKISPAALLRLTGLAVRQSAELVAMAGRLLAELGGNMLSGLVAKCLDKTNLEYKVNIEELKASLVDAGFCPPLAQAIALSWQSAIGRLCAMPLVIPAGLNVTQILRDIHDHTSTHAPALFAAEMQWQLTSRTLLEQLQAMTADADDAALQALHVLFQVQCDQLRQYCEQLLAQETSQAD
ncbi:MAG: hypothetical protein JWM30_780 [Burkholderia sp.]|nr:hypothetical protein [Burkholderia sp.]